MGKAQRLYVDIYVQPASSRNEVAGMYNDRLKIKITAPPVDGKANEGLVKFLSEELKIPRSEVIIESGFTGKNKRISLPLECSSHPFFKSRNEK